MKIIFDYNRTIFNPETGQLYPGVLDMLRSIAGRHEIFLLSMNEPGREAGLAELGIEDFFQGVVFSNTKDESAFRRLVGDSKDVLVVGDRIESEIRTGNALGLITVWIQQGAFARDVPTSVAEEPAHTIRNIVELQEIISKYEK